MTITRRRMLTSLFTAPVLATPVLASPVLGGRAALAQAPALPPTPSCDDGHRATPRASEGPFYTRGSPRRHDIAPGEEGEPLLVGGFVVGRDCTPIAGAIVDVWQADGRGGYDRDGFRLRGHVATDASGRWWFATIVPARYPGRTRHIHVKIVGPGTALTTQLYFPDEPGNARDFLFDERLLLRMSGSGAERFGRFDFVLEA